MKIVILMASPNPAGSTAILTSQFQKGAVENGHQVEVINVCDLQINPCTGCVCFSRTLRLHKNTYFTAYSNAKFDLDVLAVM